MLTSLQLYGNPLNSTPVNGDVQSTSYDPTPTWCASLAGRLLTVDIAPQDTTNVIAAIDPTNPTATYKALAAAFYNLPLGVYQYLVNTIQYQPYAGAMKGPLAVLQSGAGNDWDTDWLLAKVLNQVSLRMTSGGITTSYASGEIEPPLQETESYVGATDLTAAETILRTAGQGPVTANGAIEFNHTWLDVTITTPGGTVNGALDPSWKLRDYQAGTASLPAGTDLLASLVPFDSAGYLSAPQTESAAEYYEVQVRTVLALAADDPGMTIADVAYTGPIQPQLFPALPTVPYYPVVVWPNPSTEPAGPDVPTSMQDQIQLTLANGGTQLWQSNTLYVPQVDLSRLTINPNIDGNGNAWPELLQDGSVLETSATSVSSTASTPLTLTITYTSPASNDDYATPYSPLPDEYLCVAMDAGQFTDAVLARDEAIVNAQEVAQVDGPAVNQDAELGGILELGAATYFCDTDQEEATIDGLTGAVPDHSFVATGLTTAAATVSASPIGGGNVQFPYQPEGLGTDVRNNNWNALPISSSDTQYQNRMGLLGDEALLDGRARVGEPHELRRHFDGQGLPVGQCEVDRAGNVCPVYRPEWRTGLGPSRGGYAGGQRNRACPRPAGPAGSECPRLRHQRSDHPIHLVLPRQRELLLCGHRADATDHHWRRVKRDGQRRRAQS